MPNAKMTMFRSYRKKTPANVTPLMMAYRKNSALAPPTLSECTRAESTPTTISSAMSRMNGRMPLPYKMNTSGVTSMKNATANVTTRPRAIQPKVLAVYTPMGSRISPV